MRRIVDASILAATVLPLPFSNRARAKLDEWRDTQTELLAPALAHYEMATALRRGIVAGWISLDEAATLMRRLLALGVQFVVATLDLHVGALRWAGRLQQFKAYDAHYLALAEQMGCEFWTADERLFNNARQLGLTWVRWIGEE